MGAARREVRIQLLGGLGIKVDGEARALPPLGHARSVLAYLAVHPGSHPRGPLAARFWPDVTDESARGSLRTALSSIRKSLGNERSLVATREEVSLVDAQTDVAEFERLVAAGRPAEALALYKGPLVAGLDDDWVYESRDEFRDRVGDLLAGLAIDAEAAGDIATAIGHTRVWAGLDPLHEVPVRELMRRMTVAGDRAGAIAAYERLSERLRKQLGIAPSADTRELARVVRSEARETPGAVAGVVALMFTDLVGSTELLLRVGDDEAERLRRDHFRLLRDVIEGHAGDEVKNLGDGVMAVFTSVVDAVRCAVAVQNSIARRCTRSGEPLQVRVGINAGEPFRERDDWFGTPVVVAKRLCDAAQGGQILVSRLVSELVGGRGGFRFADGGALHLKGLRAPVEAAEVQWSTEPSRTIALPGPLVDLGATRLIARERELARLREAWEHARAGRPRVVLIDGDPGIGKTRLTAELCVSAHRDDAALVMFGRCDEETLTPYQPFVEALDRYAGEIGADELRLQAGDERALLARLVPAIERALPAWEPTTSPIASACSRPSLGCCARRHGRARRS
jgi:class 3 adenylate cyclase